MKQLPITIAAVVLVGCGNPEADQALLDAAIKGNIEAVKQAISKGADVNVKCEEGQTALHSASLSGHKGVAGILNDDDTDGMSNESELIAGTIPNNANSLLEILSIDVLNKRVKIRWSTVSGKAYILERAEMNGSKFKIIKDNMKDNKSESLLG